MKKAVLLIAVMLLLLLCSCGADVGKETETTPIDASAAATSEKATISRSTLKKSKMTRATRILGLLRKSAKLLLKIGKGQSPRTLRVSSRMEIVHIISYMISTGTVSKKCCSASG